LQGTGLLLRIYLPIETDQDRTGRFSNGTPFVFAEAMGPMMRRLLLGVVLMLAITAWARPRKPLVIVISLDGFPAYALDDARLPVPTLRMMQREGAAAASMRPINPTVTWPNHTSIITGVDASVHHVLVNGLLEGQHDGPVSIHPGADKSVLVHAQTLYDVAHAAGLKTAQADWVAIHHSGTIDWEFEESPDPQSPLAQQLVREGRLTQEQLTTFTHAGSQEWRDNLYTDAMVDVIRDHRANLILLHLLSLDSTNHRYGPNSRASDTAMAFLDDKVREVVDAVKAAHEMKHTTFFIVSDHGFGEVDHLIHANAVLHDADLLDAETGGKQEGAWAVPEGGYSLVYVDKGAPAGTAAKLQQIFAKTEGVERVFTPDEFKTLGLPTPAQSDQAPDLFLAAKDGYSFAGGDSGEVEEVPDRGSHGYLNSNPKMQAIFIAWGAGIRGGTKVGAIPNLDVAPTAAELLHVKLDHAQGKPLTQILR
jgi:predicted AlkP superfamily pyrophosphatase or phosphodiesterase